MLDCSLILTHKLATVFLSILRQSNYLDQAIFLKVLFSSMTNYNCLKSLVLLF